jgi:hypothetical protein
MSGKKLAETSERARSIAALYSEQRHVQAVENLYDDLIKREGKSTK